MKPADTRASVPPKTEDAASANPQEGPDSAAQTSTDTRASDTSSLPLGDTAPASGDFDPSVLGGGVVLWLDSNRGLAAEGGKVTRWEDFSGKGNHATGDADRMPLLKMNAQGQPFVQFTGKASPTNKGGDGGPYLRIKDNASLSFGTGDWTITFAAAYSNETDHTHNGAFGTFFGKWTNGSEIIFAGNWPVTEMDEKSFTFASFGERANVPGFGSKTTGLNDGKVRVYGARKKGDVVELRINGKVDESQNNGYRNKSFDVPGGDLCIGGLLLNPKAATRALKGDVYVVVVQKGTLGDAELGKLETYLSNRFVH